MQNDPVNDPHVVRNTTQARQGVKIHRMRYVLGIAIFGAVAAMIIAWLLVSR